MAWGVAIHDEFGVGMLSRGHPSKTVGFTTRDAAQRAADEWNARMGKKQASVVELDDADDDITERKSLSVKQIRNIVREQILREVETVGKVRQRAEVNGVEVMMNWDPQKKSYILKVGPGAESTRKLSVGEPTEVNTPDDDTFLAGTDASRALAVFGRAKDVAEKTGDPVSVSRILKRNLYTPKALQYEMKLGIAGSFGGSERDDDDEVHSRDFPLSYIVNVEPAAIAALREWLKDRAESSGEVEDALETARFHYEDSGRLETVIHLPSAIEMGEDLGMIDLLWDPERLEWVSERGFEKVR